MKKTNKKRTKKEDLEVQSDAPVSTSVSNDNEKQNTRFTHRATISEEISAIKERLSNIEKKLGLC